MRGEVSFENSDFDARSRCTLFDPSSFLFFDINWIETIYKRAKTFWHHVYAFRSLKLTFINPCNPTLYFILLYIDIRPMCFIVNRWCFSQVNDLFNVTLCAKFHENFNDNARVYIYIYDGGIIRNKITSSRWLSLWVAAPFKYIWQEWKHSGSLVGYISLLDADYRARKGSLHAALSSNEIFLGRTRVNARTRREGRRQPKSALFSLQVERFRCW